MGGKHLRWKIKVVSLVLNLVVYDLSISVTFWHLLHHGCTVNQHARCTMCVHVYSSNGHLTPFYHTLEHFNTDLDKDNKHWTSHNGLLTTPVRALDTAFFVCCSYGAEERFVSYHVRTYQCVSGLPFWLLVVSRQSWAFAVTLARHFSLGEGKSKSACSFWHTKRKIVSVFFMEFGSMRFCFTFSELRHCTVKINWT